MVLLLLVSLPVVVVELIMLVPVHELVQFICLCCCLLGLCNVVGVPAQLLLLIELLLLLEVGKVLLVVVVVGVQLLLLMLLLLKNVVQVPLLNRVVQMPKLLLGVPMC